MVSEAYGLGLGSFLSAGKQGLHRVNVGGTFGSWGRGCPGCQAEEAGSPGGYRHSGRAVARYSCSSLCFCSTQASASEGHDLTLAECQPL